MPRERELQGILNDIGHASQARETSAMRAAELETKLAVGILDLERERRRNEELTRKLTRWKEWERISKERSLLERDRISNKFQEEFGRLEESDED